MSGVSLPAIRGALPSFHHSRSYTGLERLDSRPDSRNSSVASTNIGNYTSLHKVQSGKIPISFEWMVHSFSFFFLMVIM